MALEVTRMQELVPPEKATLTSMGEANQIGKQALEEEKIQRKAKGPSKGSDGYNSWGGGRKGNGKGSGDKGKNKGKQDGKNKDDGKAKNSWEKGERSPKYKSGADR